MGYENLQNKKLQVVDKITVDNKGKHFAVQAVQADMNSWQPLGQNMERKANPKEKVLETRSWLTILKKCMSTGDKFEKYWQV